MQKESGAIPKKSVPKKSSPSWSVEQQHAKCAPDVDVYHCGVQPKTKVVADSPKVLLTKTSPSLAFYQRDELWWGNKGSRDSTDSDQSSPEIDRYLKDMRSRVEPLSPEEIQTYLASLSVKRTKDTSPLTRTPSPAEAAVPSLTKVLSPTSLCQEERLGEYTKNTACSDTSNGCAAKQESQKSFKSPVKAVSPNPQNQTDTEVGKKCYMSPSPRPISPLTKQLQQETNGVHHSQQSSNGVDKVQFSIGDVEDEEFENGMDVAQNGSSQVHSHTASSPTDYLPHYPRPAFHKSKSMGGNVPGFTGFHKAKPLLKTVMKKDLDNVQQV